MSSEDRALSLGALFHRLRDGRGERGPAHIGIEFRLESTAGTEAPATPVLTRRGLRAELDQEDGVLLRAHIVATDMAPRPAADLLVVRRQDGYLYSLDGARFGVLATPPRLLDLHDLELTLESVPVEGVNYAEDSELDGSPVTVARVRLGRDAFLAVVGRFGDGLERMSETLEEEGRTLVIMVGRDVALHYRWSTSAADGSRHSSRVSIRLETVEQPVVIAVPAVALLPEIEVIDDVWALSRQPLRDALPAG